MASQVSFLIRFLPLYVRTNISRKVLECAMSSPFGHQPNTCVTNVIRMPTPKLTQEIVEAAIFGFEEQKRRLDAQIVDLRGLFPNGHGTARPNAAAPKKQGMSAAGRRAIAEAQRKRWAAQKAAPQAARAPKKAKRKL